MKMLRIVAGLLFGTALLSAQESTAGFSMPITVSGGAMYTQRLQLEDSADAPASAGFRAVLYPTFKLDAHWFVYAAIQVLEAPYFYYDAYNPEHELYIQPLQAFAGYQIHRGQTAVVIKAGRLSSAFGAFPTHYGDLDNPLLDQPLSYIQELSLHANQIPCGVAGSCGAGLGAGYGGLVPVTLYGIPGIEVDVSSGRVDGRLQFTSGSPSNPQSITAASTYAQWVAGGGFTIRQGFRVGASAFRGPYLSQEVANLLPIGTGIRSFPATGVGLDAQWASGRWSLAGEWQRIEYDSPNFSRSPSIQSGYAEAKGIITPRIYVAMRAGILDTGAVEDKSGASATNFAPAIRSYEFGGGCWLGRNELVKASYEWLRIAGSGLGTKTNVLGAEFVVRFNSLGWSWK